MLKLSGCTLHGNRIHFAVFRLFHNWAFWSFSRSPAFLWPFFPATTINFPVWTPRIRRGRGFHVWDDEKKTFNILITQTDSESQLRNYPGRVLSGEASQRGDPPQLTPSTITKGISQKNPKIQKKSWGPNSLKGGTLNRDEGHLVRGTKLDVASPECWRAQHPSA